MATTHAVVITAGVVIAQHNVVLAANPTAMPLQIVVNMPLQLVKAAFSTYAARNSASVEQLAISMAMGASLTVSSPSLPDQRQMCKTRCINNISPTK